MAAAYGGGGLGMLSAGAFGLIRAEAALARRAIGEPTGTPPDADGVYGAHHARRADPAGDARRLQRLRARRRAPAPDARRDAGRRARRVRRPPGRSCRGRGRRRCASSDLSGQVEQIADSRPGRRRDHDRRQRRHPPGPPADRRAPPRPRGPPAARAGRRGRRRHLPRPRHGRAGAAAAALDRPPRQPAARRGADHRGRRGRRPHGVARRHPRAGVRGLAVGDVRAGPASTRRWPATPAPPPRMLPSVCAALGLWFGAEAGGRAGPGPRRGRPADLAGRGRGGRRARHRGRRRPGRRPGPRPARAAGRCCAAGPERRQPTGACRPPPRRTPRRASAGVVTGR